MLKYCGKGEKLLQQFLLLSTIFCYLMLDLYVKTRIRFSLREKWLFEIIEVEITRVDCIYHFYNLAAEAGFNGEAGRVVGSYSLIGS